MQEASDKAFVARAALVLLAACGGTDPGAGTSTVADASLAPDAATRDEDTGTPPAAVDAAPNPDAREAEDAGLDAAPVSDGGGACPSFAAPVRTGLLLNFAVTEASGVVNSRRNADVLWVHNDSGAAAQIHAITRAGAALATYTLDGAGAVDWEDIAVGPGPQSNEPYLYVGDIGDNGTSRSTIAIYRVREPVIPATPPLGAQTVPASEIEKFVLRYPDRAHNAETLLVDPTTGDLFIVEKASSGDSQVFRAAAPLDSKATITLESIGRLRFGSGALAGNTLTTGGDISPSGSAIAIRTYDRAFLWRRAPGQSVAAALTGAPCPIPLATEGQGEALGFASDERGYYTLSEGRAVPISYYARQ